MAKFSCSYFFLLILAVSAMLTVAQGGNVKRCSIILDPKECNIGSCIDQCFKQYKGNGVCGTSASGEVSVCYCVYPC
ncbi:hypothetical protein RJ639_042675 [Escallonia herrerae]|uniref:Uncharacterized protein n=1 Tax=Escallonia herrerae TaxID=1293975 RepID=A0AA89B778_9ASTE|nr:hypothetical protein RJ639_042675 [Escallonia herrerae]